MKSSDIHKISDIDYTIKIPKIILIFLLGFSFTFAFLNNFPIDDKIKFFIKNNVLKNSPCAIDFSEFKIEFLFIPKMIVSNVNIPASCFNKDGESLKLGQTKLFFMGPSFSPLGVAFKAESNIEKQPLAIRFSFGLNEQVVNFHEEYINLQSLANIPIFPLKMKGKANLFMKSNLKAGNIEKIEFRLLSKDFTMPSQTIQDIKLSSLPIKLLDVKINTQEKDKEKISITMGELDSPIRLTFKGSLLLNSKSFSDSKINLTGQVKFSDSFIDSYSIIKLMLSSYTQNDGWYQMKIQGTFSNPSPSPL